MPSDTSFRLVVEDELTEIVARKAIMTIKDAPPVSICYGKQGIGYIKKNIQFFNNAAKISLPFIVIVDLDRTECAPTLVCRWNMGKRSHHLLFRVAVRETESWLLADRERFSSYFNIPKDKIQHDPDTIQDPKQYIVNLARQYCSGNLKRYIVPADGSSAATGVAFNSEMKRFVNVSWDSVTARRHSKSLDRFVTAVEQYIATSSD